MPDSFNIEKQNHLSLVGITIGTNINTLYQTQDVFFSKCYELQIFKIKGK
ncbi:hypothetical protein SAMN05421766_102511 [Zobellia uliginosa]|uniref:Uncharacterized protein n=1 Tax=Zobellia uliginosa TaxID=143224 RepID=A0ABY1KN59_9FLAO|nr:hypothetical protein SAMN05421766_102511 [Zobellia uliginosa]